METDKTKNNKEYFFILYLKKVYSEDADDKVQFINLKDKDNIPKCILTKEKDKFIVKIFKFNPKPAQDNKIKLEFFYDGKKYELILEKFTNKTFLFDVDLTLQSKYKKLEQPKRESEKMNYFDEALSVQKEYEKMNTLYKDSINLCTKKPSLQFLINIFVKIYNTELCSKLLDIFNKKIDKLVEDNNKDNLQKYKFDFDQIVENREDIISKFSLNSIDFYGLILCYFNICNNEKYKELFDKLSKKEEGKKIIFEIMLTYKLFFKNQTSINKDLLDEFIKYASTKKDFTIFKNEALFYLKDINTFLEIMENNKDNIIKIKSFEPIEVLQIKDDENIKFGIINPKIESITDFSKKQKKLLINLNGKFWENLAKKSYGISRDNIELCSTIREIFKNYNSMVLDILPDDNKIKKEIKFTFKRGIFMHQIDKIIKEYIANNPDITNMEIIELIQDYDEYYTNSKYYKQREPKILDKIDLEKIKIDLEKKNEIFIKKFQEFNLKKYLKMI